MCGVRVDVRVHSCTKDAYLGFTDLEHAEHTALQLQLQQLLLLQHLLRLSARMVWHNDHDVRCPPAAAPTGAPEGCKTDSLRSQKCQAITSPPPSVRGTETWTELKRNGFQTVKRIGPKTVLGTEMGPKPSNELDRKLFWGPKWDRNR
jgi:hypothetical protein